MGRVTLQTVADKVGVSRMTVSNAFSRPDQLSPGLRKRILSAAEDLGYVGPDPAGRMLARGTSGTVGIFLTESLTEAFTDEIATSFLGAIAEQLAPTGLALTLLSATGGNGLIPARDVAMDGALVYSCNPDSSALDWLLRRRLPIVFVDQAPLEGVPCVNVDDRGGASAAAKHLVELGHTRIGILTTGFAGPMGLVADPTDLPDGHVLSQRMQGWLDVLNSAGIRPRVVRQPHDGDRSAYGGARLLLAAEERPTGVLCFSDRMAHEAVCAAEDLGLQVPSDLSVVGFDDNPLAQVMRPELTTVRQDVGAKGRAAAAALTQAIERARTGLPVRARHVVLPTELIVRASTAVPPESPSKIDGV